MPEWGQLPIPEKLLRQGVKDMVRVSDARMSGTSYGTCVLHVAPESAVGGPLALVRDGDEIELDVPGRRLVLHVPDAELARRRATWTPPPPAFTRGYGKLYLDHVLQAPDGADFDFLRGGPGQDWSPTSRRATEGVRLRLLNNFRRSRGEPFRSQRAIPDESDAGELFRSQSLTPEGAREWRARRV